MLGDARQHYANNAKMKHLSPNHMYIIIIHWNDTIRAKVRRFQVRTAKSKSDSVFSTLISSCWNRVKSEIKLNEPGKPEGQNSWQQEGHARLYPALPRSGNWFLMPSQLWRIHQGQAMWRKMHNKWLCFNRLNVTYVEGADFSPSA